MPWSTSCSTCSKPRGLGTTLHTTFLSSPIKASTTQCWASSTLSYCGVFVKKGIALQPATKLISFVLFCKRRGDTKKGKAEILCHPFQIFITLGWLRVESLCEERGLLMEWGGAWAVSSVDWWLLSDKGVCWKAHFSVLWRLSSTVKSISSAKWGQDWSRTHCPEPKWSSEFVLTDVENYIFSAFPADDFFFSSLARDD